MSGERRRAGGWLLPVIVVGLGAYFLLTGMQGGTLKPAALKPVNWAGIPLLVAGAVAAIAVKKPAIKLIGVLLAGVGAILIICL